MFNHRSFGLPLVAVFSVSCSLAQPQYLQPEETLEIDPIDELVVAQTELVLPIRLETAKESTARTSRSEELGVDVPFVSLDDMELSIEWIIRNLSDSDGTARIHVTGANEFFAYVPDTFFSEIEDQAPPPPLMGDVPKIVPAQTTITGLFREDELREMAIDLELITRGGVNPLAAVFAHHEDLEEIVPEEGGPVIPLQALAHLIRLDIALIADRHMVLEYAVRIRSKRAPDLVHERGLSAPAGELTTFAPQEFIFVPPPMP